MREFEVDMKSLRELTTKLTENGYLVDRAAQWEFAFDAVQDLVMIVNPSLKIKFINKAFSDRLELPKKEAMNKNCYEILQCPNCKRTPGECFENYKTPPEIIEFDDVYIEDHLQGWFNFSHSPIHDDEENLLGFICTLHDVTKRKEAENALKKSEEQYRHLVKYAPSGIYEIDFMSNKFTNVNDVMCIKSGYTREELLNDLTPFDLLTPNGKEYFKERLVKIFSGEDVPDNIEFEIIRKDRTTLWVVLFIKHKYDNNNNVVGATVVSHDIDERKRAELALQESEAKYADLYNNAPDMFVSVDTNTALIIQCNQTLVDMLGYTKEEIIGRPIFYVYTPESRGRAKKVFRDFAKTGEIKDVRMKLQRKDGSKLPVSLSITAIRDEAGNIIKSRSSWRDISEQVEVQEALRKSEEKYRNLYTTAPLAVVVWDMDNKVLEWNANAEKVFGWKKKEIKNKDFFDFIVPKTAQNSVREVVKKLKDGKTVNSINENITKNGDTILCEWYNSIYHDCADKPIGIISLALDITERQLTESKLRDNEALMKSIFKAAPAGIGVVNSNRTINWSNAKLREMTGYSEEELRGANARLLYPDDDEYNFVGEAKYEQIKKHGIGNIETVWKRKDDRLIKVLLSSAPIDQNDLTKGVTFTALDITSL